MDIFRRIDGVHSHATNESPKKRFCSPPNQPIIAAMSERSVQEKRKKQATKNLLENNKKSVIDMIKRRVMRYSYLSHQSPIQMVVIKSYTELV